LAISDTELVRSHLDWRYSISDQGNLLTAVFSLTFECGDSCISRPLTKYDSAIAKEIAEIWPDLKSRSQNKLDKVKSGCGGIDGSQSHVSLGPKTTELAKRTVCPH